MPKCAWLIIITITMLNKTNDEALFLIILNIVAFFPFLAGSVCGKGLINDSFQCIVSIGAAVTLCFLHN